MQKTISVLQTVVTNERWSYNSVVVSFTVLKFHVEHFFCVNLPSDVPGIFMAILSTVVVTSK